MSSYMVHMDFIWHPECHSDLGTMPTIRPQSSVRSRPCVAILSVRRVQSRPQLQYIVLDTHLVPAPSVAVSYFMPSRSSFPPSSSFIHSSSGSSTSVLNSNLSILHSLSSFLHPSSSFIPSSSFFSSSSSFLPSVLLILSSSSFSPTTHASHHCVPLPPLKCGRNCATLRCGVIIALCLDGFRAAFRYVLRFVKSSCTFTSFIALQFSVSRFVWRGSSCICALKSSSCCRFLYRLPLSYHRHRLTTSLGCFPMSVGCGPHGPLRQHSM